MPVSPHTRYDATKCIWERSTDGGSIWVPSYTGNYTNLLADSLLEIWAHGDAADPSHYATSGAGRTVGRETTIVKLGTNSCKLTASGANAALSQYILPSTSYDQGLDSETFTYGGWVYAITANKVRLHFVDGVINSYSPYHPGGNVWKWLQSFHTVSSSATYLRYSMDVADGYIGYLSAPTVLHCKEGPIHWYPSPCIMGTVRLSRAGPAIVGTTYDSYDFGRPAIVRSIKLGVKTPPTTTALVVDVNHWDGSASQPMCVAGSRPAIAATKFAGEAVPDGSYQARCFTGVFGDNITHGRIDFDIDQIGAGNPGTDLKVNIRALQFCRPWETLLGYSDIK